MKTVITLGLILSLAFNAALGFLVLAGRSAATNTAPAAAVATAVKPPRAADKLWSELRTDDPRALAERLRAAGFPERVVRAVVAAQIRAPFEAQIRTLQAATARRAFWKNASSGNTEVTQITLLYREASKAVSDILGPDPDEAAMSGRGFPYLSPEKAASVRAVLRDFDDRRMSLFSGDFNYTIDRDKLTALDREQHETIVQLLSPAELRDYDLRTSDTARSLRQKLAVFKPTEEEFKAIYDLQAVFDEKYRAYQPGMTQDEMRRRFEEQRNLTAQIKAALSPERAAAYERQTDSNYVVTAQLVARLELPAQAADDLYALQKEYQDRRNEVFRGGPQSREQLTEQMTKLQQEASARAKALLGGDRGFNAYRQYGGGWLNNMVPRMSPSSVPPQAGAVFPGGR